MTTEMPLQEAKPRGPGPVWRFARIVAYWSALACFALYAFGCYKAHGDYAEVFREFVNYRTEILSISALAGIILGGIHDLITRLFRKASRASFGWRELGGISLIAFCLAAYPGFVVKRHFDTRKWIQVFCQTEVNAEISALVEKSDFRHAVRRMERACRDSQEARRRLGPEKMKSMRRNFAHSGISYYFCSLGPAWDDLTEAKLPHGLTMYLEYEPMHSSSGGPLHQLVQPEKWAPLGREMALSDTAILRILGFWLLEDRENFVLEVYRLHDSGDRSIDSLYELVRCSYDPDPRRAIHRLGAHEETKPPASDSARFDVDHDGRIYQLTRSILMEGQELGNDVEIIRAAARRFTGNPATANSPYHKWYPIYSGNSQKLESLVRSGNNRDALRLMETACENLRVSRERLGEDFTLLHPKDALYDLQSNALPPTKLTTLNQTLPRVIFFYLNRNIKYAGGNFARYWPGGSIYRDWRIKPLLEKDDPLIPLVREMSTSNTPILHAYGAWLLGNGDSFVETVYRQFDSGDRTFDSLYFLVLSSIDTNNLRALHRVIGISSVQGSNLAENTAPFYDSDHLVFLLACEIVHEGGNFGGDLQAVQEATRRFVKTEPFRKEYASGYRKEDIEGTLLKLGIEIPK